MATLLVPGADGLVHVPHSTYCGYTYSTVATLTLLWQVTMGSYTYRASDFSAANAKDPDAGAQWVCNAQLHRCVLLLVVWRMLEYLVITPPEYVT